MRSMPKALCTAVIVAASLSASSVASAGMDVTEVAESGTTGLLALGFGFVGLGLINVRRKRLAMLSRSGRRNCTR